VEVVTTLSGTVTAAAPVTVAVAEAQVGADTAPAGAAVTEQFSVTAPVNPPEGVTLIVEFAVAPGLATVTAVPATVNDGTNAVFTVTCAVVVAVTLPVASTPETVNV
jgi:hypothetical protein